MSDVQETSERPDLPLWVKVGLYGFRSRASLWRWLWLSSAVALAGVVWGFWFPLSFAFGVYALPPLLFWASLRWVDRNGVCPWKLAPQERREAWRLLPPGVTFRQMGLVLVGMLAGVSVLSAGTFLLASVLPEFFLQPPLLPEFLLQLPLEVGFALILVIVARWARWASPSEPDRRE
jgi:hypothetical protein